MTDISSQGKDIQHFIIGVSEEDSQNNESKLKQVLQFMETSQN